MAENGSSQLETMSVDDLSEWLMEKGIPLEFCQKLECKLVVTSSNRTDQSDGPSLSVRSYMFLCVSTSKTLFCTPLEIVQHFGSSSPIVRYAYMPYIHADHCIDGKEFLDLSEAEIKEIVPPIGIAKQIIRLQPKVIKFVVYVCHSKGSLLPICRKPTKVRPQKGHHP